MKKTTLQSLFILIAISLSTTASASDLCISSPLTLCLGNKLIKLVDESDLLSKQQKQAKKSHIRNEIYLSLSKSERKKFQLKNIKNTSYQSVHDESVKAILDTGIIKGNDFKNDSFVTDDLLAFTPLEILYHQALINVYPKKIESIKQLILAKIARTPTEFQSNALTNLALLEGFSGAPDKSLSTISHALKIDPENQIANIIYHTLKSSQPSMASTIQSLGYQQSACVSPESQVSLSLTSLLNKESIRQYQLIDSIPAINLKLKAAFLLSTFINKLNQCQFHSNIYDHSILSTLERLPNEESTISLGVKTLRAYRRYR